jgi:AcrR family transcriptional regulator
MLDSAVHLLRRHGYNGTGFREVVAHSGAPRGSIYHHFPGGKAQMGAEAVTAAAKYIDGLMGRGRPGGDFVQGFERFWGWWTGEVEADGFQAGCPVLAVAAESHPEAPELAAATGAAFSRWRSTLQGALRNAGVNDDEEAERLADLIVAAFEGATVMSRASGDRGPLVRVGRQLAAMLRKTLPHSRTP